MADRSVYYREGKKKADAAIHEPILKAGARSYRKSDAYKANVERVMKLTGLPEEKVRRLLA